jgi:hypothetical protein
MKSAYHTRDFLGTYQSQMMRIRKNPITAKRLPVMDTGKKVLYPENHIEGC